MSTPNHAGLPPTPRPTPADMPGAPRAEQVLPPPPERWPTQRVDRMPDPEHEAWLRESVPHVERLGTLVFVGANRWLNITDAFALADAIRAAARDAVDAARADGTSRRRPPSRGGRDEATQRRGEALKRATELVTGVIVGAPTVESLVDDALAAARRFEEYVAGDDTEATPDA